MKLKYAKSHPVYTVFKRGEEEYTLRYILISKSEGLEYVKWGEVKEEKLPPAAVDGGRFKYLHAEKEKEAGLPPGGLPIIRCLGCVEDRRNKRGLKFRGKGSRYNTHGHIPQQILSPSTYERCKLIGCPCGGLGWVGKCPQCFTLVHACPYNCTTAVFSGPSVGVALLRHLQLGKCTSDMSDMLKRHLDKHVI